MNIETIARICHEANRAYCASIGDNSQKSWDEAEEWQRDSAAKGVLFRIQNPDAPASVQHDAWMQDKVADGWVHGAVKDAVLKTHPCIVAYEQLPAEQQFKDALFVAIVNAAAEED